MGSLTSFPPRPPASRAGFGAGHRVPGGHRSRVTPVPIPNTEVKPATADGTAWETAWESRSLPGVLPSPTLEESVGLFSCTAAAAGSTQFPTRCVGWAGWASRSARHRAWESRSLPGVLPRPESRKDSRAFLCTDGDLERSFPRAAWAGLAGRLAALDTVRGRVGRCREYSQARESKRFSGLFLYVGSDLPSPRLVGE